MSSTQTYSLDIQTTDFPTFAELPEPTRCFLCEITENVSTSNPTYLAKDLAGTTIWVGFFHEDASAYTDLPYGTTISVNRADQDYSLGGHRGLRLQEGSDLTILNCGLGELKQLNDFLQSDERTRCTNCYAETAPSHCAACQVPYCNADCQMKDWSPVHERVCGVVQHLRKLNVIFG